VLAFQLCEGRGLIFCDDYLWNQRLGLVEAPKFAINSFVNVFRFKLRILSEWFCQLYLQKISD
jgi:hypothetical protein